MSDALDKPATTPEDAPQGFSCPGIGFLPGLLVILNVHLVALSAGLYLASTLGLSWSAVAITAVPVAGFWILFLLLACVIGTHGAINLTGIVSAILFWLGAIVGVVAGVVWLMCWWLTPTS
jgi:hypothetical protein